MTLRPSEATLPSMNKAATFALSSVLLACGSNSPEACVPDPSLAAAASSASMVAENHHRVDSFIVIDASAEEVWDVLTDFETMPDWSSSFQGLAGDIEDGGAVVATYLVPNPETGETSPAQFPHTLSYEEGIRFGWSDPIAGLDGLQDNHRFELERLSDCQTRFVQTDAFTGTNPNLNTETLANISAMGYEAFNAELKAETERRFPR